MQRNPRSKSEKGQGVDTELINSLVLLEGNVVDKEPEDEAGRMILCQCENIQTWGEFL